MSSSKKISKEARLVKDRGTMPWEVERVAARIETRPMLEVKGKTSMLMVILIMTDATEIQVR